MSHFRPTAISYCPSKGAWDLCLRSPRPEIRRPADAASAHRQRRGPSLAGARIGANVAIFSLVNALILKPLPVHEPDRLVILGVRRHSRPEHPLTNPQWEYIRDHQQVLVGVGAYGNPRFNLNSGGETRNAQGLFVSGRFFDTLGVTPHIGRLFTTDDDRRGGGPDGAVAVLSYGFWQREYGGRADVIGRADSRSTATPSRSSASRTAISSACRSAAPSTSRRRSAPSRSSAAKKARSIGAVTGG